MFRSDTTKLLHRNTILPHRSVRLLSLVVWFVLVLLPGYSSAQSGALLRLILPPNDKGNNSRNKQQTELQQKLEQIRGLIDSRKRRAAIDKQIFDNELVGYKRLLVKYRKALRPTDLSHVQEQRKLLLLSQRCIADLIRIQSVEQLVLQSYNDLQEALRIELDALDSVKKYLGNHYSSAQRGLLLNRITTFEKMKKQTENEQKQIATSKSKLTTQRRNTQSRLAKLRYKLSVLSPESPTTQPRAGTQKIKESDRAWNAEVSLLRLNRYRIRIRLLQLLQHEERLNSQVTQSRLRFLKFSLHHMKQKADQLARLSEGGLFFVADVNYTIDWSLVALHTRSLRKQGWKGLTTNPRQRGLPWFELSWFYIIGLLLLAILFAFLIYRLSQRMIDRLTERAEEEKLLLRLWKLLRFALRLLRDVSLWALFLLPTLWLLHAKFQSTVLWEFFKVAVWVIILTRLGWTIGKRLFHPDTTHRLLTSITDKSANQFRRTIQAILLWHVTVYPIYKLLKLLSYPKPLLQGVIALYLFFLLLGLVFLLLHKDTVLTLMPQNTVLERALIVFLHRLYLLAWTAPIALFGLYLWGYQNLAIYAAKGITGSLVLLLIADLLTVLLWDMFLWMLGFTNEEESLLYVPPAPPQQVELDPSEGGPSLPTENQVTTGSTEQQAEGIEQPVVQPPAQGDAPEVAEERPKDSLVTSTGLTRRLIPYFRFARLLHILLAGCIWFAALAGLLALWEVPGGIRAIPKAFTYPLFQAPDLQITLWILLKAFGVFALTLWLSRTIPEFLNDYLYPALHTSQASAYVTNALLRYFIMSAGAFLCLSLLQIGSRGFLIVLAVFGLSLSYGLRRVVHNFISSLLLFFGRAVQVGDYIEVGKHRGKVKQITSRSTTLQTSTGKLIFLPNSNLIDQAVVNWLGLRPYFRDRLVFYVALDSNVDVVQSILSEVAAANTSVQPNPKPTVRLREMNGGALEFGLSVTLLNPMAPGRIRSDLRLEILRRFREEGVEFALNQQELHLHPDLEEGVMRQLTNSHGETEQSGTLVHPSRWDHTTNSRPLVPTGNKEKEDPKT